MCSVLGVISDSSSLTEMFMRDLNQTLKHRGPDDSGIFISPGQHVGLGHNRLSIMDLSQNGAQPMVKHNRAIVFNGEIFNFEAINTELAASGYSFSSRCDTETILSAYDKWGVECFKKFNGFFAVIIYDIATQEVIVARDRLGVKQLVYTKTPDGFVFASEIKALLEHPRVKIQPNVDALRRDLLLHFWNEKIETHFKNIFHLQAGNYGIIKDGRLTQKTYWSLETILAKPAVTQNTTETLRDLLIDATKIRMHADVPVSILLSGGLDSSLITAFAATNALQVDCFSLDYGTKNKDLEYARELVKLHPQLKHNLVKVSRDDFSEAMLQDATFHMEEPLLDQAYISVYRNYQAIAQQGIKVTLNGQGADEAWLGYYNFYDFLQFSPDKLSLSAFTSYWTGRSKLMEGIPSKIRKSLVAQTLDTSYLLNGDVVPDKSMLYFSLRVHLQNMLMQEDRMSMAHGVECRLPFVDYRVIELAAQIPAALKVKNGQEKYILRQVAQDFLPKSIWQREKAIFPMPPDAHTARLTAPDSLQIGSLASEVLHASALDLPAISTSDAWKILAINQFEKAFFV